MTSTDASATDSPRTITEFELQRCERANASSRTPAVEAGYAALTSGWPDDPETVEEAKAHPEVFAHKTMGQVADHFDTIIQDLARKPVIIGHSFRACAPRSSRDAARAAVSVAIAAPFRGVLPLPISSLKSAFPVLRNPAKPEPRDAAHEQFRFAFASGEKDNTVPFVISNASFEQQQDNNGVTEIVEIPGPRLRPHHRQRCREVADTALEFVKRCT
jgi:non-heme chloroperoxidase